MERQNSRAAVSQETLASLQHVDPSPIESPFEQEKELKEPDLELQPPQRTSSLGLSGSGHGSVYYLTRIQRYSSYAFSIFAAFHITNTSLIPLITRSVPASESYLLLTRPYYQSPALEPLLITIPLTAHVLSGLFLRIQRRNAAINRFGLAHLSPSERLKRKIKVWPPVSNGAISGFVLTPLLLGHVFVNRFLPWWIEGGSSGVGLSFVSHGFAKHSFLATAGYVALVGVATGHIVWGWARWLGILPRNTDMGERGKNGRRRWWVINGVVALVSSTWMAGGLGVVGRGGKAAGWVGKGFDEIYAHVPLLNL